MKKKIVYLIGAAILIFLLAMALNRYFCARWALRFLERVDIQWMGYTDRKVVALTFDDGPDPRFTPRILDFLKRERIPATFFVVGANAAKYPELLVREFSEGHEIGNHTMSHPKLGTLSRDQIKLQITEADRWIQAAIGQKPRLFRPPYEQITEGILLSSRELEKQIVLSTVTLEHGGLKANSDTEVKRDLKLIFPGAIILAHDGRLNRAKTVAALPKLVAGIKAKGYRIVPLRELLHQ